MSCFDIRLSKVSRPLNMTWSDHVFNSKTNKIFSISPLFTRRGVAREFSHFFEKKSLLAPLAHKTLRTHFKITKIL